jgi:choline dehydrogenase-like flavoprotein
MPYEFGPDQVKLNEDVPIDPPKYVAILRHLFGGCVTGRDPATRMPAGKGRLHGMQDLWLAIRAVTSNRHVP